MKIPEFKFNSQELAAFKNKHMRQEHYTFTYLEQHWYNSLPVEIKDVKQVWQYSNVKYIVDHGSFKTLETSISGRQNTHSTVMG